MHWPCLFHPCMFLISLGFSSSWRGKTKKNPVRWWLKKRKKKASSGTELSFVWPHRADLSSVLQDTLGLTCSQQLVARGARLHGFPLPDVHLHKPNKQSNNRGRHAGDPPRCTATHLSLVGEAVGADEALVELDRGLRVARLVLVPEVDIEEAEPLRETFVPLKVV